MSEDLRRSELAMLIHYVESKGDCEGISCIGCPLSWSSVKRPTSNTMCENEFVYSKAKELLLERSPSSLFDVVL